MSSGYTSIWLEDFAAGQHAVYGEHHFTREAVLEFARNYDPQAFHLDDEAAAKMHFKRLSASGWHTHRCRDATRENWGAGHGAG